MAYVPTVARAEAAAPPKAKKKKKRYPKKATSGILAYQPANKGVFIANIVPGLVKGDPRIRLSKTPFGEVGPGGVPVQYYYAGLPVPWKRNPAARPEEVKRRNEEFKREAESLEGETGVYIVRTKKGKVMLLPAVAALISMRHGGEKIAGPKSHYWEFGRPLTPAIAGVTALV